jgi:hypothetical protein
MAREFYQSDADLHAAVDQLNALFDPMREFKATTARKDHVDVFGVSIRARETYYKRECGGGFGNEVKVSSESMERLCGAILFDNRWMSDIVQTVDCVRKKQKERLQSSSQYLPNF